jgi:phospholipid transport system substrate-binding protein
MRFKSFCLLIFLWITSSVFAASDPMNLMQQVTDQTLHALQQNQATLHSNPKVVYRIIHQILLPHVDMQEMSRVVLGRSVWTSASAAERQAFIAQFKTQLIRTYSSALAAYKNETVKYMPMRSHGGNSVQVDSVILQQGGPPISVNYRLVFKNGSWKLYDLIVDGVSLVESYRAQFADALAQNGLHAVIQQLAEKNAGKMHG